MRTRWSLTFVGLLACTCWVFGTEYAIPQEGVDALTEHGPDPDRIDRQNEETPLRRGRRRSFLKAPALQAGITAAQQRQLTDNCLFGKPVANGAVDLGPTKMVFRDGYVLEHSSEAKVPYWVAEHSTKSELQGSLPRTNPFAPDPQLNGSPRAELADYRGSGFDRGHMCPNGNFKNDDRLRIETFFLSNMVPQVGRGFNQNVWADLEDKVRTWTRSRDESWIISGPMYFDPAEENASTADGFVDIALIGDDEVQVPTHCYKIVVAKRGGNWESIAFVLENTFHSDNDLSHYIQSIDWIEARTGFNFMPAVAAETGDPGLEAKLEANPAPQLWP